MDILPEEKQPARRENWGKEEEEEGCEGQSSSPSPLELNARRPKQEIDNVRIEVWAFRSPKLALGCTDQTEGALGLVLLHYREEDGAEHANLGRAGTTEEPHRSEDVKGPEGSDHLGAAMPNMGLHYVPNEMVMLVEPVNVPEAALPVVVVQAPVHVPEVALPVVEAPVNVDVPEVALPVVLTDAAGHLGEAAALVDMIGFTPSPCEWEAVESLLLLGRRREKRLKANDVGGCCACSSDNVLSI